MSLSLEDDPWGGANPDDPDFRDKLYERYAVLRANHPVHKSPRGMYRLTRYDDCVRLLKRSAVGRRTTDGVLPNADETKIPRVFMLDQDPPSHTRLRALVNHAFTPRALADLEHRMHEVTDSLLAEFRDGERVDLIEALAIPLPATMICEMLGVPFADRSKFVVWVKDMTYVFLGQFATPDQQARSIAALTSLIGYISGLIDECAKTPREDLLSLMVRAEEAGDRLSRDELLFQALGLLVAGFETTTGLIGNGVRQLILHPDQLELLRRDPSLIDSAVEECLRFDGPIVATGRVLHEDIEFSGHVLRKNSTVMAILAAANRDPEQFESPDEFRIDRTPNRHLAFGGGIHICLGAHLARLEGRIAIGKLIAAAPRMALETDVVTWGRSLFRVPGELWLRLR